jgi:hypothetical protein
MTQDADRGIYRKFKVERTDGSSAPGGKHSGCSYFVLDLDHDPFARPALGAYAKACRKKFPELARQLERIPWLPTSSPQCGCREAMCPHTACTAGAAASIYLDEELAAHKARRKQRSRQ